MKYSGSTYTRFAIVLLVGACCWAVSGVLESSRTLAVVTKEADSLKKRIENLSLRDQVEFLRELKTSKEQSAHVSFYLGNAYLNLENPDSAVIYYREAIALDSTYTKAYVNLGIAFEQLRQFDDAKSIYKKAIVVNPQDVLAHCHLGHYYHARGELGEAVDHYRRALEIDPQSAQAHYNLGLAFADSRLFAEAIREWEKVVELSPESELGRTADENLRLIRTYMELGNTEKRD